MGRRLRALGTPPDDTPATGPFPPLIARPVGAPRPGGSDRASRTQPGRRWWVLWCLCCCFLKSCVGSGSVNIFRVPLKLPFNRSSPPYFLVLSVDVVQRKVSERVAELQCLGAPPHSALRCRPLPGEPALNSIFLAVGHI